MGKRESWAQPWGNEHWAGGLRGAKEQLWRWKESQGCPLLDSFPCIG